MREPDSKSDWRVLCELASKEQDPEKLIELIRRLNQLLDEKFRDSGAREYKSAMTQG